MSDVIFLSDVRLSFPNLAEPQKRRNEQTGEERISYNAEFIMAPNHPGFAQFMQRFAQLAAEKGKEHANALMQMIMSDRKSRCFGQGSEKVKKDTFQPYDGYAGMVYITTGQKNRPQMIKADGSAVDPANTMEYQALARKLYGGCRVNAAIKPWWQNPNPQKQVGHGIRCDPVAIQFLRDDKPFGDAAPDTTGMFGAVAGAPANPFGAPAAANPFGQPAATPGFFGQPQPSMPAPPVFGAPTMPGLPSFMGR